METGDYLTILRDDIHTTVMATVDKEGRPVTRVVDVMLVDDRTLYFLTAKGKAFHDQLTEQRYVSVSGSCGGEGLDKGEASLHMKAVSVRGTVRNIGTEKLGEIFERNPYMAAIYPTEASRRALEVFCICDGEGEFFDLSTRPITRASFRVGSTADAEESAADGRGYFITDACIGCGSCLPVCPQSCILPDAVPYRIEAEHCLHCGNCMSVCPTGAVERR